jgi:epoxyqueuosine reductase
MQLPSYSDVVNKAHQLGFQKVSALSLPQLEIDGTGLKQWLANGFHGEMEWMVDNLEKRLSPTSLMPGTRTILCAAMNYYPGDVTTGVEAKIARYAQGDDYHDVLKQRLKQLLVWLKSFDPAIEGRPLVDSAPIMEKTLAMKAGLGWQGKHSNLITRDMGSWVFLGELLLNVTFPDAPVPQPVPDLCGSCRRCITACPTDAIVDPYVVDSTRCISYWTIEYKGEEIPSDIREQMEGWIFGCDICQEVCPWNIKFQQETTEAAFVPRPCNRHPRLSEIETMTDAQFRVRYRKSPVKRTKIRGIKRNAKALQLAGKTS